MRMLNELADGGHDDVPYDGPTDSPIHRLPLVPQQKVPRIPRFQARPADLCVLGS